MELEESVNELWKFSKELPGIPQIGLGAGRRLFQGEAASLCPLHLAIMSLFLLEEI